MPLSPLGFNTEHRECSEKGVKLRAVMLGVSNMAHRKGDEGALLVGPST